MKRIVPRETRRWVVLSVSMVLATQVIACSSSGGSGNHGGNGSTSSGGSSGASASGGASSGNNGGSSGSGSGSSGSSGGSGGSSGSGSGGDDGGAGVIGCGLSSTNATCNECLQASCCASATTCAEDTSCSTLADCVALAPFSDGGVAACDDQATSNALQEYSNFQTCMSTSCSASCDTCQGSPGPCSTDALESECTLAGCTWGGSCTGVAESCLYQYEYACDSLQGCYYDTVASNCDGVSTPCSDFSGEATCTSQLGCSWQMGSAAGSRR